MPANDPHNGLEARQERRDKKLRKKQERIAKHGKTLGQMYRDVVTKRLKKKEG
jgi:hypothetical protein